MNDLSLPIANHHICNGSNYREVEYKAMNMFLDLPDGFYAVKDHELYMVDLPIAKWEGAKTIRIPTLTFNGVCEPECLTEEIQHVGYDEEQCGRTK